VLRLTHILTSAAALASFAVLGPLSVATAGAAPIRPNEATVISVVTFDRSNPSVGYVRARYSCEPSANPPHLWVSVKQTADGTPNPALLAEESGFNHVAATWLQSHPTNLQCDGRPHVESFEVNALEPGPTQGSTVGYGHLVRGQAYVQFCLFTGEGAFLSDQRFQFVQG
jgi:hypothetical protein